MALATNHLVILGQTVKCLFVTLGSPGSGDDGGGGSTRTTPHSTPKAGPLLLGGRGPRAALLLGLLWSSNWQLCLLSESASGIVKNQFPLLLQHDPDHCGGGEYAEEPVAKIYFGDGGGKDRGVWLSRF